MPGQFKQEHPFTVEDNIWSTMINPILQAQNQTSFEWLGATEEPEESPLDKLSAKDLLKELEDDRTADVEAKSSEALDTHEICQEWCQYILVLYNPPLYVYR